VSAAGLAVIALFIVLVVFGVPVWAALAAPSIAYFLYFGFAPIGIAQNMIGSVYGFTILAVPLFIFVGSIMNHSGTSDKIFDFATKAIGHRTGGLAHVNIIASLLFSGISGSAVADIGGIGRVLIDSMDERGYKTEYSAALTGASATVGPIFPPSIPLIIYGLYSQTSVLKLLLAGAVPALLFTALFMVTTVVLGWRGKFPEPAPKRSRRETLRAFVTALPALLTPVILILGMLFGYFSPTEVAAVTVVYVVVINIVFYQDLSPSDLWAASREAAHTTSRVLIIVAAAGLFAFVMSIEGVADTVGAFLLTFSGDPILMLLVVNVMLLILGMFIDPLAALLMSIPLVVPPLTQVGYDPIHIGVVMVLNLMIGLLTPPMGVSLFVASDIADVSVSGVVKELGPYYVVMFLVLLIVSFVPALSLWLPGLAF
jgi:tripartite ATP-independent transporter DctM subunit